MFGGITFLVSGKMCVSVGKARLMCRVDPVVHDAALQRRGCRTVVMSGRKYRGFVYVDGDTVRSERELGWWIRLALDFNTRANPLRGNGR
jgi:TfoX/Sxy family transcriptional regulator of competence genes